MHSLMTTPESLADQCLITQQVFLAMANMELALAAEHAPTGPVIASILKYSRPSEGTMLLECTPPLAYAFTARFMQVEMPKSLDADVRDAMGELANMIGGNLKGLMPEETCVSLPLVLVETSRRHLLKAGHRLSRVCMAGPEGHLWISLFAHLPSL